MEIGLEKRGVIMTEPKHRLNCFRRILILAALGFGGLAVFAGMLAAQDSGTRGILPEEFVKARPAKPGAAAAARPSYKLVGAGSKTISMAALRKNSTDLRELGITIWRLRPSVSTDGGPRILVQEGADTISWIPERVASSAPLRKGDRVRLSIESPRTGYLYVIDREQYASKELGDPFLIFPTSRTHNGDNEVTAGRLIEIPGQEDRPTYFSLRESRPDQTGEVLTVIVADKPLEGLTLGPKALALSKEQVAQWEQKWTKQTEHFEMTGGKRAWTKAEQEAGLDGTRLLTQDDPGPQTIYRVATSSDEPILVKVGLKYGGSKAGIAAH
jgi:hypothetical protein